jgi:ABC-type branched-subunit amino acid transport system substrate-binding protein
MYQPRTAKHPLLTIFFAMASLLILANCSGSGGFGNLQTWDFGTKTAAPAEAAPDDLSQDQGKITPAQMPQNYQDMQLPGQAGTVPTVKVAILLPLGGDHGNIGDSLLKASQMALFDIAPENFELMPYDTKGTAEGAREAAQQAVNNGAQLVLGPVFSHSVRAAQNVVGQKNTNMIAFSTDWSITNSNTYTMGMLPFDQIDRIVSYAAQNNIRSVGVIAPDNTYGRAITNAYKALANKYGIQTVDTLNYAPEATNLTQEILKFSQYDKRITQAEAMLASDKKKTRSAILQEMAPPFDAVLIAAGGDTAATIANLLTQYDLPPRTVKRLGIGLFDDDSLATQVSLRGSWFAAPSPKAFDSFSVRYSSLYGSSPHRLASLAYDVTALSAVLAAQGIRQTGQPGFDDASLHNPNGFAGIDGIFRFLQNGTTERGLSVLEFKSGTIQEISPAPKTFLLPALPAATAQ